MSLIGGALGPPGARLGIGDVTFAIKWRSFDHAPLLGRFAVPPGFTVPIGDTGEGRGDGTSAWPSCSSPVTASARSQSTSISDMPTSSAAVAPAGGRLALGRGRIGAALAMAWMEGGNYRSAGHEQGRRQRRHRWADLGADLYRQAAAGARPRHQHFALGPSVRAWYARATWNIGRLCTPPLNPRSTPAGVAEAPRMGPAPVNISGFAPPPRLIRDTDSPRDCTPISLTYLVLCWPHFPPALARCRRSGVAQRLLNEPCGQVCPIPGFPCKLM